MQFDPGISVTPTDDPLGFQYGPGVFGPEVERRTLDAIRKSLADPTVDGPEVVYAIAMDVGNVKDRDALEARNLLFGVVTYAAGRLGEEPVRSQGHAHAVSASCGCSTPEVYEIWRGRAVILMQESLGDDPGRCFAVEAGPGDVVVVPPAWGHATISADPDHPLTFGAWCVRDYGYEYDDVRRHGGLAYFPILAEAGRPADAGRSAVGGCIPGIVWRRNPAYQRRELVEKRPESYDELGIDNRRPIYSQFEEQPDRFLFVSRPDRAAEVWDEFVP